MFAKKASAKNKRRAIWQWVFAAFLVVLLVIALAAILISRAEPILRARVIETLTTRFHGKVTLDEFHVSLSHGFQVRGEGLKIYGESDPSPTQPGVQPLIVIAEFRFQTATLELLHSPTRVNTVYLKG